MTMACILCGADKPLTRRFDKGEYSVASCPDCALVQLVPTPSDATLAALYSGQYFGSDDAQSGYGDYASQEAEYLATFAEDVKTIQRYVRTGDVLDVGCGYGYFMRVAHDAGLRPFGLDLSEAAVERASARFPGRVFRGTLSDSALPPEQKFDVIFASHVVEHITAPVEFMRSVVARLKPGGLVALVTPNIESLLSRVSGSRWVSFKIPEHVAYYSPATITRLIRRGGHFESISVKPAFQYYRLPFVAAKVRQLIQPVGRLVPPLEETRWLRDRVIRVTSGSLCAVARRRAT
jgi:2-polyprenyl-3-methyl-5-hydroxy-6-metoxy-1,4-benzoquinol methylase